MLSQSSCLIFKASTFIMFYNSHTLSTWINDFNHKLKVAINLGSCTFLKIYLQKTIRWCLAIAHHAALGLQTQSKVAPWTWYWYWLAGCGASQCLCESVTNSWTAGVASALARQKRWGERDGGTVESWGEKFVTWHQQFVIKHFDNNLLCARIYMHT